MNLLLGLVDRVLFAVALIAGMLLPQFVDLYSEQYRADYKQIADVLARDDARRERNATAEQPLALLEATTRARYEADATQMRPTAIKLETATLPAKIVHLTTHLDIDLALKIVRAQPPNLRYTPEAFLCGIALGALASLLFQIVRGFFRRLSSRRYINNRIRANERTAASRPAPEPIAKAPPAPTLTAPPKAASGAAAVRREPRAL